MSGIKSLAKDTVIYGSSSILGKFLNWLLVPYYTRMLSSAADYGIVTNIYGYTALLTVLLTYGMETGFLRFANKKEADLPKVYSTTLIPVGITSLLFILCTFVFINPVSSALGYAGYETYLGIMAITVAMDAFMSIPFVLLRYKNRPIRFAGIKMWFVFMNILLNIFFLNICPALYKSHPGLIPWFNPDYGVGYIFWANLIATFTQLLFLIPEVFSMKIQFDYPLLKKILKYSFPLLILGLAGIMNQTIDKIIFPYLFQGTPIEAKTELGIYGACSKIAIVMVMFTQAFRFAYEPFIFAKNKSRNDQKIYSDVMKYFVICSLLIYLGVMFYLDIVKYVFLHKAQYYDGLRVVPITMLGLLFFGIYFNLSMWYKLTDETQWGAYFSFIGFLVMMVIMLIFIPRYSYMACAWAGFICNLVMMVISYIVGQKKHPIWYDLRSIGFYFLLSTVLYIPAMYLPIENLVLRIAFRTVLLFVFIYIMVKRDIPLRTIPVLNKYIK